MVEGAKGNQDAAYFLSSGCAPLRTGLGITGLLLPAILPAHLAASEGGSIDLGNEIIWDDCENDKRLSAAAFVNRMSVIKVGWGSTRLSWECRVVRQLHRSACMGQGLRVDQLQGAAALPCSCCLPLRYPRGYPQCRRCTIA